MRRRPPSGFTLIELLVALAIFAIMAVLSYRALATVLDSRDQLETETHKWRDCATFFARVEQDLHAFLNRPARSAADTTLAPFLLNPDANADATLALTRAGFAQSDGMLAAPQRVGYRLRNGQIELVLWPHLDASPRTTPQAYAALTGVNDFAIRLLDAQGNWQTRWPIPNATGGVSGEFSPRLVEIKVTLKSGETLMRLFAMRNVL